MGISKKKIVLISSGQPSLNPRIVKECDVLSASGFDVELIYQYRSHWATLLDQKLFIGKKWKPVLVGGEPEQQKFKYLLSRLTYKISRFLFKALGCKMNLPEHALGRCTYQLADRAINTPASLYIAHNLGALPAAVLAAEKNHSKCGFDAEDFHRYETSSNPEDAEVKLKKYIEDKYFPKLDYLPPRAR